uniref:Uncharacterized protein n=1 Tax=Acrobeloides nanus TaxID=290746 RepID=A0A914CF38_9BILA
MATAASMTYKEPTISAPPTIKLPESLFNGLMDCRTANQKHVEALRNEDPINKDKFKKPSILLKKKREKEAEEIFMNIQRKEQQNQQPETPTFNKPKKSKPAETSTQPIFPTPSGWPLHPHMPPMYGLTPHMPMTGHGGQFPPNMNPMAYPNYVRMHYQQQQRAAIQVSNQVPKMSPPGYPAMTPSQPIHTNLPPAQNVMGPPPMPNSGAGQKVVKTTPANPIMPMIPNHSMASTSSQGSYPMPQTPMNMNYPMGQPHERNPNDASVYYEQQYQQAYGAMSAHATPIASPLFKVPTNPNPSHMPIQHAQHTPKAPPSQAQPYYPPQGVSTSANPNSVQAPPSYSQTPYATNQEKKMSSYPYHQTPNAHYPTWPHQQQQQPPPYYPPPPSYPGYSHPQPHHSYYNHPRPQAQNLSVNKPSVTSQPVTSTPYTTPTTAHVSQVSQNYQQNSSVPMTSAPANQNP